MGHIPSHEVAGDVAAQMNIAKQVKCTIKCNEGPPKADFSLPDTPMP